jgi:hypothetical protein
MDRSSQVGLDIHSIIGGSTDFSEDRVRSIYHARALLPHAV